MRPIDGSCAQLTVRVSNLRFVCPICGGGVCGLGVLHVMGACNAPLRLRGLVVLCWGYVVNFGKFGKILGRCGRMRASAVMDDGSGLWAKFLPFSHGVWVWGTGYLGGF